MELALGRPVCTSHAFAKAASKEDDGDVSDLFEKALGMQSVIMEEIAPGRLLGFTSWVLEKDVR